jgi:hypothetical protein
MIGLTSSPWQSFSITTIYTLPPNKCLSCSIAGSIREWASNRSNPHVESANKFANRMKLATEEAKVALSKAKDDMARYYNQRRLPMPTYAAEDKVYLDASDIGTNRPSQKLSHCRLGPFPIERQVSRNAYRLKLPFPMRHLHPVFNVVKLTPSPADPIVGRHPTLPPPPEVIDGEEEYLVVVMSRGSSQGYEG